MKCDGTLDANDIDANFIDANPTQIRRSRFAALLARRSLLRGTVG